MRYGATKVCASSNSAFLWFISVEVDGSSNDVALHILVNFLRVRFVFFIWERQFVWNFMMNSFCWLEVDIVTCKFKTVFNNGSALL